MGYILKITEKVPTGLNKYSVYQILFPNGKRYIGCTSASVVKRMSDHISALESGCDYKIYRAMKKYGINNLKIEVIGSYPSKEEMFEAEKYFIKLYDTQKNGYNTTTGGEGCPGREITDEGRMKISEGQKKRFSNEDERNKSGDRFKKWIIDNPDQFQKAIEKKLKVIKSCDYREKMSEKMKQVYSKNPHYVEKTRISLKKLYEENIDLKIKQSTNNGGSPIEVYKDNNHVGTFPSLNSLVKDLGLSLGNAWAVLKGERNTVKGYNLKRVDYHENIKFFNNITVT
jgi:group I intron endonuclease